MKTVLDGKGIERIVTDLAKGILEELPSNAEIATIGIRSRGEIIAQRLSRELSKQAGKDFLCGTLDITLYRDDLSSPHGQKQPLVRTTEIGFDINDKIIILVDDVLNTGRSALAGMHALMDLGRPKTIKLAVLVERAGRELPIQADFAGYKIDVKPDELVQVKLMESDECDEVVVG